MKNTTLCYLEQNGCYLMLHRVKKKQDENAGKWIGIGGKLEENESPEECCCREFLEETGLTLTDYRYRGIITFVSDQWEGEYMHHGGGGDPPRLPGGGLGLGAIGRGAPAATVGGRPVVFAAAAPE